MPTIEVLPLFCSPLFATSLDEDLQHYFDLFRDGDRFPFRRPVESGDSRMSERNDVLCETPDLASLLLSKFTSAKDQHLRLETTTFRITTSWLTKTEKGEASHYHVHKNSMFSGVLYFESIEDGSDIEFANYGLSPSMIDVNKPTERNVYNSPVITMKPQKNMLLFFPSYLYHRVTKHESTTPRYSLAFNLMPVGLISTTADSEFDFGRDLE